MMTRMSLEFTPPTTISVPFGTRALKSETETEEIPGIADSRESALSRTSVTWIVKDGEGCRAVGASELGDLWLKQFHSAPEQIFQSIVVWLKSDPDRRAALVKLEHAGEHVIWFAKETSTRSWRVRLAAHFSHCRAANAWHQGLVMRACGIRTPRPIAYATRTRQGAFHEYLLTESLADSFNLRDWLVNFRQQSPSTSARDNRTLLIRNLATLVQSLHLHRFDHRDLKSSNILVTDSVSGPVCWIIDLDGVWRWPCLPMQRKVQNLARLWVGVRQNDCVTLSDALRFLKNYLGHDWRSQWKSYWRTIARRANKKFVQIQRKQISLPLQPSIPQNSP